MANLPRFAIGSETFDKLPKVVLDAIQDETKTSLYGAQLLLDAYSMNAQNQLIELGRFVEAGNRQKEKDSFECAHHAMTGE